MKLPSKAISAREPKVRVPELVISTRPLPVVVRALLKIKSVPFKSIPEAVLVLRVPVKVVVPEEAASLTKLAVTEELAVVSVELIKDKAPRRVAFPTLPTKLILPVPAVKVKASAPAVVALIEEEKVIFPAPAPVLKAALPVSVVADRKEILSLVVVISAAVDTAPIPF